MVKRAHAALAAAAVAVATASPTKRARSVTATATACRKSAREHSGPASYHEDELVACVQAREEQTEKATISSGGNFFKYAAPADPPGMKSTAYMCKHPAVKGPVAVEHPGRQALPTRSSAGELVFADTPNFRPNLTPAQVLKDGAFGGTYFRPIKSAVTGLSYTEAHAEFPEEWFKGLSPKSYKHARYRADANKWGVECGGALDMWESSGWISNLDPYGWFQWYCRFYLGRRSSDDARQISRFNGVAGPTGRFRNQLINKVLAAGTQFDDPSISPVIRQTLHHWGYELCLHDLEKARRKKKK